MRRSAPSWSRAYAFSMVELMVSVAVLGLLVILLGQMFNGASIATNSASKHIDNDTDARALFERMAIDFVQMIKRPDVDFFLKDDVTPQTGTSRGENDQIAFFCQIPGNVPASSITSRSPASLVAYRIEPGPSKMQRLGYGLLWDAVPPDGIIYSTTSRSSENTTIFQYWPFATNLAAHSNYETFSANVFRLEYYYILKSPVTKNGTPMFDNGSPLLSRFSAVPWDDRIPGHTSVEGLRDVAAIVMVIAIIDPRSRVTASEADLVALSDALPDFEDTMGPGELESEWQKAVETSQLDTISPAAIRVYSRSFYLQ